MTITLTKVVKSINLMNYLTHVRLPLKLDTSQQNKSKENCLNKYEI